MADLTYANALAGLLYKDDILPVIRIAEEEAPLWQLFQKKKATPFQGRAFYAKVQTKRNEGLLMASSENPTLPADTNEGWVDLTISPTYWFHTLGLTDALIELGGPQGSAQVGGMLAIKLKQLAETFGWELDFATAADASAFRTQINGAVSSSTSAVVDSVWSLRQGMVIDVFAATSGGSATIDSKTINDINVDTKTLTLSASSTCADNSYVFREDCRGNAWTGIRGTVDDGDYQTTYHGLTRSSYGWSYGNITDSTGDLSTATNLVKIQKMITKIRLQGGNVGLIVTDPDTYDAWCEAATSFGSVQYQVPTVLGKELRLPTGVKTIDYLGISVMPNRHIMPGTIYCIDPSVWYVMQTDAPHWRQRDGAVLRGSTTTPSYTANMVYFSAMVCTAPRRNGRLIGAS